LGNESSARKGDLSSSSALPPADRRRVARRLLAWFRRRARDLPWRHNRDPYAIWVSEVMLQQTQVATVIPYFERFLHAFPTLAELAAAEEQQVLHLWEGMGYYRRARDLHRAARQLVSSYGGQVPDDPESFRALPGVGRYTAGAVLSQAFDRRLPILEANSQRVLSRLLGLRGDVRSAPLRQRLWQAAEDLLPAREVGQFNQALMELGALVCTPRAPDCPACPLAEWCVARRQGTQEEIPTRADPPLPVEVKESAVVVRRGARVLLARRPLRGRWAGMWEFPHGPLTAGESYEQAAARLVAELTGLEAEVGDELLTVKHGVNHHRITLVGFEATHRRGRFLSPFYECAVWVRPEQLASYPVSAPQRRLARLLLEPRQPRLF
jgi:A/G-specific adenine glycosylase